jgi:hypothetical protein
LVNIPLADSPQSILRCQQYNGQLFFVGHSVSDLKQKQHVNQNNSKIVRMTTYKTTNEKLIIKQPGVCVAWEKAQSDWAEIKDDEEIVRKIWEKNDLEAYMFLRQCVLSF